jgi:hypothetical protein
MHGCFKILKRCIKFGGDTAFGTAVLKSWKLGGNTLDGNELGRRVTEKLVCSVGKVWLGCSFVTLSFRRAKYYVDFGGWNWQKRRWRLILTMASAADTDNDVGGCYLGVVTKAATTQGLCWCCVTVDSGVAVLSGSISIIDVDVRYSTVLSGWMMLLLREINR